LRQQIEQGNDDGMKDEDENIDLLPSLEDRWFFVGEVFIGLGHWFCFAGLKG